MTAAVIVALALVAGSVIIAHGLSKKAGKRRQASGSPSATAPAPDLAAVVPANYRMTGLHRASLTGGVVPDVVVASAGPTEGSLELTPADLQVLTWDPIAKRWDVIFDAQKTPAPTYLLLGPDSTNWPNYPSGIFPTLPHPSPILRPRLSEEVTQVTFAQFLPKQPPALVFSIASSGGADVSGEIGVISFFKGQVDPLYWWSGHDAATVKVAGSPGGQVVDVTAEAMTAVDPMCCPIRRYHFTVSEGDQGLVVMDDNRPWLGAIVAPVTRTSLVSPLRVVRVVAHSPAAGVLRRGDLIVAINGERVPPNFSGIGPGLVDVLARLLPGDDPTLTVLRGGSTVHLSARLGSMSDASAVSAAPPRGYQDFLI